MIKNYFLLSVLVATIASGANAELNCTDYSSGLEFPAGTWQKNYKYTILNAAEERPDIAGYALDKIVLQVRDSYGDGWNKGGTLKVTFSDGTYELITHDDSPYRDFVDHEYTFDPPTVIDTLEYTCPPNENCWEEEVEVNIKEACVAAAPSSCGDGGTLNKNVCVCDNANGYYIRAGTCGQCSSEEIGVNNECVCDSANGYIGTAGSCEQCNPGEMVVNNACVICDAQFGKSVVGSNCVCDAGFTSNSNHECVLDLQACTLDGKTAHTTAYQPEKTSSVLKIARLSSYENKLVVYEYDKTTDAITRKWQKSITDTGEAPAHENGFRMMTVTDNTFDIQTYNKVHRLIDASTGDEIARIDGTSSYSQTTFFYPHRQTFMSMDGSQTQQIYEVTADGSTGNLLNFINRGRSIYEQYMFKDSGSYYILSRESGNEIRTYKCTTNKCLDFDEHAILDDKTSLGLSNTLSWTYTEFYFPKGRGIISTPKFIIEHKNSSPDPDFLAVVDKDLNLVCRTSQTGRVVYDTATMIAKAQIHFSQDQSKAAYVPIVPTTQSSSDPGNIIRIFDLVPGDQDDICANEMELTFEHDTVVNFFFLTNTKLFVVQRDKVSDPDLYYYDIADISTCTGSTCTVAGDKLQPIVVDGVVQDPAPLGIGAAGPERVFHDDGHPRTDAYAVLPDLSFESEYLPVSIEAETNIAVGHFDLSINKFADFVARPQNQAECDEAVESVNRNLALHGKQVKLSFRGLELKLNDKPDVSCSATPQLYDDVVVVEKADEAGVCDFANAKLHIGISDGIDCSNGPVADGEHVYFSSFAPPEGSAPSAVCDSRIELSKSSGFQTALTSTPAGQDCFITAE